MIRTLYKKIQQRNMTEKDEENGGASRDRTDDPLLAKQVLSQLSYGPITHAAFCTGFGANL